MYWICNYKMDSHRKHFIFLLSSEKTGYAMHCLFCCFGGILFYLSLNFARNVFKCVDSTTDGLIQPRLGPELGQSTMMTGVTMSFL